MFTFWIFTEGQKKVSVISKDIRTTGSKNKPLKHLARLRRNLRKSSDSPCARDSSRRPGCCRIFIPEMSGNGSFVPLKLVAECSRNHSVQTNLSGPGRQVMRLFVGALRALNHRENTPGKALEAPLQSWDGEYSDCDATGPV